MYRVLSNLGGLKHPQFSHVETVPRPRGRIARLIGALRTALRSRSYDVVLLNCAVTDGLFLCAALRVFRSKCVLVLSDPVMNPPRGKLGSLRARMKRWLLRRVDLFIVHQRDLREYSRLYGISPERSHYVPFKVNLVDIIRSLEVRDGDYVFSCGVTNRDWTTLGAATRDAEYPVVVSMPDAAQLARMGSTGRRPSREEFGPNARFVENGSDPREWLQLAAGARLVVLPVTEDAINPSGVSTYLSIMALRKCVVISDGPATRGILSNEAIIVPPASPLALRQAIDRLWNDKSLIAQTAGCGYDYAEKLGDSERLLGDLAATMVDFLTNREEQSKARSRVSEPSHGATLHT